MIKLSDVLRHVTVLLHSLLHTLNNDFAWVCDIFLCLKSRKSECEFLMVLWFSNIMISLSIVAIYFICDILAVWWPCIIYVISLQHGGHVLYMWYPCSMVAMYYICNILAVWWPCIIYVISLQDGGHVLYMWHPCSMVAMCYICDILTVRGHIL